MSFDRKSIIWVAGGVLSAVATALCISELRKILREKCTRNPLSRLEDGIQMKDLAILAKSPNVSLRRSAEQVLLDRAMKKKNLDFIAQACYSDDEFQVLKAVTVLGLLGKNAGYRNRLVRSGVLENLSYCLIYSFKYGYEKLAEMGSEDVRLQRVVSSALFDLICDDNSAKVKLVRSDPSIVATVLSLMSESRNKEVMRWCLFLAHQWSICESLRKEMIHNNAIPLVAQMLVVNQGDPILMRLCLQMMVMYANASEENEVEALHEMAKHDVLVPTAVCLKADDHDLVYWAAALLHEFAVKGVQKPRICEVPNIIKSLQTVLLTSEALLQRIILRIISFLCHGNTNFSTSLLQCTSLLARLPICFASGDSDVIHWSVVVLHDILLSSGSFSSSTCKTAAEKAIAASDDMIKSLIPLANSSDNILVRLVAEIIGFFCSVDFRVISESLLNKVVSDGVIKAVLAFSQSEDSDLQFWASALLLNLTMSSDQVKEEIVKLGGLKPLIELAISDSREPGTATQAAKTLVMLGFVDKPMPVNIKCGSYQHGDFASITISGKDYCCNKPGVNMVVLDFLNFKVTEITSFDTGHDKSAIDQLTESVDMVRVGAVAFLATRGEANYFMTDKAKESLKGIGLENYDFRTGELWAYVGQKHRDRGEQIAIERGFDRVELQTVIWFGTFVSEQVRTNILLPLIEVLVSTPATSSISKVSELELLTILARHDNHKQVMVSTNGFLEYMSELIWNMSCKTGDQLRANPIAVAHCIGAMKIISAISITKEYQGNLVQSPVLSAVLSLLYSINDIIKNAPPQQVAGSLGNKVTVTVVGESGGSDDECETLIDKPNRSDVNTPFEKSSFVAEEVELAASGGLKSPSQSTVEDAVCSEEPTQPTKTSDDFEELFCSLARLAVTTLYNCIRVFTAMDESRERLIKSGALHVSWCTLLNSPDVTRKQIGLPVEVLLNWFGSFNTQEKHLRDQVMELDDRVNTAALMLSGDRLEASNNNWTFESVRATFCVGRSMYYTSSHPSGWYYEVTVKSTGIMQIGWQTDQCKYGPEKGVGVGDDVNSCAFDGARCKVWSGPPSEQHNNDYGREWVEGDTLSCLMSWTGDVSFWLGGVSQGVAFKAMNMNSNWYPAVSLAMDQQCVFNFGSKPFRYEMPDGYVAAGQVVSALVKFVPRLSSCWTPVSGSMDSIVEEDEEEEERTDVIRLTDKPVIGWSNSSIDSIPQSREVFPLSEREPIKQRPMRPDLEERPPDDVPPDQTTHLPDSFVGTPSTAQNDTLTSVSPVSTLLDTPDTSFAEESRGDNFVPRDRLSLDLSSPFYTTTAQQSAEHKSPALPRDLPAWLLFSPAESLVSEEHCDTLSVPCLYFEAELKHSPSRTRQMGFFDAVSKEKIFCQILDNTLLLPKTTQSATRQECFKAPDVVGCGIMWPAGVIIFTLDGVATGHFYHFPSEQQPLAIQNILPYLSCSRVSCNYGQRDFLFTDANFPEVRWAGANLLHEHVLDSLPKQSLSQLDQ